MLPRWVIIGAGAIGVSLAAELKRAGNGVVLVARGAQLAAARGDGITYARPDGSRTLDVSVVGAPEELELTHEDIIVLATKTQDAADALATWAGQPVTGPGGAITTAGASLPLLTTQNGLDVERSALRHFATVIAGVLVTPAHFVEPGVIVAAGSPSVGVAWIGAYPDRDLPLVAELARTLRRANYATTAVSDISAVKRGKLVASCTFVLDALFAPNDLRSRAAGALAAETRAVLSGLGEVTDIAAAMADKPAATVTEVPGYAYGGSSTWQSLARSGSLETAYLNGEVVLQARLQGLDAPANAALTVAIETAARQGLAPRSLTDTDLLAIFPALRSPREQVFVDVETLAHELASSAAPALLDVRWKLGDPAGAEHFAEGHIPGAVYVDLDAELAAHGEPTDGRHPLPSLESLQASARTWGLTRNRPVVVYDDNGGTSAARAWWLLRWAGVSDVRILDGSLGAWTSAGRPLDRGANAAITPGDITLTGGHLPVLDADATAAFPATGVLLDARAGERYRGEVEPVDPRAGHIPGALSAPTTENLTGDGRFLSEAELTERFDTLGARAQTPVAVYCGSGVTAAHEIAALASLGIDAALYPGSWSAWSNDPQRPAVTGAEPGQTDTDAHPFTHRSPSYAG